MVECRRLKNVRLIFGEVDPRVRIPSPPPFFQDPGRISRGLAYAMGTSATETPRHAEGPRYRAGGLHRFPGNQVFEGHLPKNARLIFGVYAYYHETTRKTAIVPLCYSNAGKSPKVVTSERRGKVT